MYGESYKALTEAERNVWKARAHAENTKPIDQLTEDEVSAWAAKETKKIKKSVSQQCIKHGGHGSILTEDEVSCWPKRNQEDYKIR